MVAGRLEQQTECRAEGGCGPADPQLSPTGATKRCFLWILSHPVAAQREKLTWQRCLLERPEGFFSFLFFSFLNFQLQSGTECKYSFTQGPCSLTVWRHGPHE